MTTPLLPLNAESKTASQNFIPGHPLADKIGEVIAHRIDFPKVLAGKMNRQSALRAKSRPLLTAEERDDVRQTVAFVLCATGALERSTLTFGDWKECFRAVRGPECLRIDRKAKNKSEIVRIDTMTPEQVDVIAAKENLPGLCDARRKIVARRLRHLRACCLAALAANPNRQSKHNRRKAIRVLRFLASQYTAKGEGFSEIVDTARDVPKRVSDCMAKFKYLVQVGEELLTAEALRDVPVRRVKVLKSFAELSA
jgi:hypothetical protein